MLIDTLVGKQGWPAFSYGVKTDVEIVQIPLTMIRRDPGQVRKIFNNERIDGLAQSVGEVGLLHPVLVKALDEGYQLVAGERRCEAAKRLGHTSIAAIVLAPGIHVTQIQLVENLQREDLNPMERALAVKEYMDMESLSKATAAKKLGVPRTTLTDWLDCLHTDERFQRALIDNFNGGDSPITLSHISEANALAARLKSPSMSYILLDAAITYRLSKVETREVCALVRSNANVSVEEAVKAVRRPADVNKLPKESEDGRYAVEKNLQQWMAILERSTNTLSELGRIAPKYLPTTERERILTHLQEIRGLVDEALEHITDAVAELGRTAS